MRPSTRFLAIGLAALATTLLAVAAGRGAAGAAAAWGAVLAGVVVDLLISPVRPPTVAHAAAPAEIDVGESGNLAVRLDHGESRSAPGLSGRIDWPRGLDSPQDGARAEGGTMVFPIRARRRGIWRLDQLWLVWNSRFGLLEFVAQVPLVVEIAVSPNIRAIRSGKIDAVVGSALHGMRQGALVGEGSEFHQLRDFVAGMDSRTIDWKRSARHRALVAKEMYAERNQHVIFALDNGHLMREEIGGLSKVDHQIAAMLALAWAALRAGDFVGLFAYDARPRTFEAAGHGRAAFARLRARAAALEYRSVESNHTLAISELHRRLQRRSLIVLFSDFVDSTSAELLVENVVMLNRRHLIIFATFGDPELRRIADAPPQSLDDVARAVSAAQLMRERRLVFERLSQVGVGCIEAHPTAMTGRLISAYARIKSRDLL